MNALTITTWGQKHDSDNQQLFTPRDRAIHTTAWFLNGRSTLKHIDSPRLSLAKVCLKNY